MKTATLLSLFFGLLVALAAGSPASASCTESFIITRIETSQTVTGSSCLASATTIGAVRTHDEVTVTDNLNEYLFTINYCTRDKTWTFIRTISTTITGICWRETSASCIPPGHFVPTASPVC